MPHSREVLISSFLAPDGRVYTSRPKIERAHSLKRASAGAEDRPTQPKQHPKRIKGTPEPNTEVVPVRHTQHHQQHHLSHSHCQNHHHQQHRQYHDDNGAQQLHPHPTPPRSPSSSTMMFDTRREKSQLLFSKLQGYASDDEILELFAEDPKPDCTAPVDDNGNAALHLAIRREKPLAVVQTFLAAGADPNQRNHEGKTPLHLISFYDRPPGVADALLEAGADIDARDHAGRTWMFCSTRFLWRLEDRVNFALHKGARLDARDARGRSLLFGVVERKEREPKLWEDVRMLSRLGLDPRDVDLAGNTLLHEAVLTRPYDCDALTNCPLEEMGLDLQRPNHAGRTVLHVLCTEGRPWDGLVTRQRAQWLLARTGNINAQDISGNTPLSLAASWSELLVAELLAAGADPTIANFEGLTPLHQAARSHNVNAVGLLVDAIARTAGSDAPKRASLLNAKDYHKGYTALHYALRLGRPETVSILLDAGADPRTTIGYRPSLSVLFDFEDEDVHQKNRLLDEKDARQRFAQEQVRQYGPDAHFSVGHEYRFRDTQTTRLDEILELLLDHSRAADYGTKWIEEFFTFHLNDLLLQAERNERFYTVEAFQHFREHAQSPGTASYSSSTPLAETSFFALSRRSAVETVVENVTDASDLRAGKTNRPLLERLLVDRYFHAVEALLLRSGTFLAPGDQSRTNLHFLVSHGYAALVDQIGGLEAAAQFREGRWHAAGDPSTPGLGTFVGSDREKKPRFPDPLLRTACERPTPNMAVIRVLVEKLRVDVNELGQDAKASPLVGGRAALHDVARGRHWWHAAQAIPYLVREARADIELRDADGNTPLHVALQGDDQDERSLYRRAAIHKLIELGADVQAVSGSGHSCLDLAAGDEELVRLFEQAIANAPAAAGGG